MADSLPWNAFPGRLPVAAIAVVAVACVAQTIRSLVALYIDYRVSPVSMGHFSSVYSKSNLGRDRIWCPSRLPTTAATPKSLAAGRR